MISVLIAAYNAEKYISRCLDSLVGQTFKKFEVIIVNDCSLDATATIVEQYVKASSLNIRLINLPVNSGVSTVRNRCLKEAKGTAFYFVDADDWLEKECLQKLHDRMFEEHCDMVVCNFMLDCEKQSDAFFVHDCDLSTARLSFIAGQWAVVWRCLIKRDLVRKLNLSFESDIKAGEDYLFLVKLILNVETYSKIEEPLYHYVVCNTISLMRGANLQATFDQFRATEMVEKYIEANFNSPYYRKALNYRRLYLKKEIFKQALNVWKKWRPEANKFKSSKFLSLKDKIIYRLISLLSNFL